MQNVQILFPTQQKAKQAAIEVPWMLWHKHHLAMGAKDADKACVVAMLQNINAHSDVFSQQVSVMLREGRNFVVAAGNAPANSIMLPPCIPRQCKV